MLSTEQATLTIPGCEPGLTPDEVDERLGIISKVHSHAEAALAFFLGEVERRSLYLGFGFKDTVHYATARHGIEVGTAYRLLRVARACERSPLLREAFSNGEVALSKIDVIEPLLTGGAADAAWVGRAKTESRRALKTNVQRVLGEEPDFVMIPLTVRLTPSQWRVVQDAIERCRKIAGHEIGEAEAIEMMAVEFLNTPVDPVEVVDAVEVANEECTGAQPPESEADQAALRRRVLDRDGWRCSVPDCDARRELEVDHVLPRARFPRSRADEKNLITLCTRCHRLKTQGLLRIDRLPSGELRFSRPQSWHARPGR